MHPHAPKCTLTAIVSKLGRRAIEILQEIVGFRFVLVIFAGFAMLLMQFDDLISSNYPQNQSDYQF
jgi:hypothetical protein